jgi:hypothetical protein
MKEEKYSPDAVVGQACVWQVKNTSFGNEKCNYQYNLIIS